MIYQVSVLQYLPSKFARANGLNNRQCEIDLRNEHGKSWTLDLTHNKTTGQAFVRNGWTSFCKANGIKAESFRRFKFVQTGTRPVLQLCPNTEGGDEIESGDCSEPASMNHNKIVALEFKPYMFKSGRVVSSNTYCLFFFCLYVIFSNGLSFVKASTCIIRKS